MTLKNKVRWILHIIAILLYSELTFSQPSNQIDLNGKKQGYWLNYKFDTTRYARIDVSKKTDSGYVDVGEFKDIEGGYYEIIHKLCSSGDYKDNQKENKWTYYYDTKLIEHGKNFDSIVYFKGDSSIFRHVYTKEIIHSVIDYTEGAINGVFKTFYVNGKTKSELYYIKDKPTGFAKLYYDNGQLMFNGELLPDGMFYQGTEYYDTGRKKRDKKLSYNYIVENYTPIEELDILEF